MYEGIKNLKQYREIQSKAKICINVLDLLRFTVHICLPNSRMNDNLKIINQSSKKKSFIKSVQKKLKEKKEN